MKLYALCRFKGLSQNLEKIISAFSRLTDRYQAGSQLNIIGDGSNLINLKQISSNNPNIIFDLVILYLQYK